MMQPPLHPPREGQELDTVLRLINRSSSITVGRGLELLERDLSVVDDISDDLIGGSVTRHAYAILHAKADLELNRALNWGTSLIRPYLTLSDGADTARFNLGAYFTNAPRKSVGNPYAVNGVDVIDGLYDQVGSSFSMAKDAGFLDTLEDILLARGYVAGTYIIDPRDRFKTTSKARTWVLDDNLTWLKICNELCNMIGYRGLWSDWDGRLHAEPYLPPYKRPVEWSYDAAVANDTLLGRARSVTTQTYRAPNRWVVYRTNLTDGNGVPIPPVLGAGAHEHINWSSGPTSVEARDGRVITKQLGVEAADQEALVRRTLSIAQGDIQLTTRIEVETALNPLHWHFDVIQVDDPSNASGRMLATAFQINLDGRMMSQNWSMIYSGEESEGEGEEGVF